MNGQLDNPIPRFLILGPANLGKSTIVSTLSEDDRIEVCDRAGTTKNIQNKQLEVDGSTYFEFCDSPGLEMTAELLQWFEAYRSDSENDRSKMIDCFLDSHRTDEDFDPECKVLSELRKGAIAVFVGDSSQPPLEESLDILKTLAICGVKRLCVLNCKEASDSGAESDFTAEWSDLFVEHANSFRRFNGTEATYAERLEIFKLAAALEPTWVETIQSGLDALALKHREEIDDAARSICELLANIYELRETEEFANEHSKATAAKTAIETLQKKISELEDSWRKEMRRLFRHTRKGSPLDELPSLLSDTLFSDRVRLRLGLTKAQKAIVGGIIGSAIGGSIDAFVFFTFPFGTLLCAAIGAAWALVGSTDFGATMKEFTQIKSGRKLIIKAVEMKLLADADTPWVMLDRAVDYVRRAIVFNHGNREVLKPENTPKDVGEKEGASSSWSDSRRAATAKLIAEYYKGKRDSKKAQKLEAEFIRTFGDDFGQF